MKNKLNAELSETTGITLLLVVLLYVCFSLLCLLVYSNQCNRAASAASVSVALLTWNANSVL